VHSQACAGIRRPEAADGAPVASPNLEAGANGTGSAVLNRETSPAGDSKEGPVVSKPQTPNPQASSPQPVLGSQERGKGTVTAVAKAGDPDKSTIVPTPQTSNPSDIQAVESRLGVPESHHSPDLVRAPSKPRVPYNPFARTLPKPRLHQPGSLPLPKQPKFPLRAGLSQRSELPRALKPPPSTLRP
jgi:hypothetical protein